MTRYAVLLSAGPDRADSALNALEYAISLDDAGHTVAIYLDGAATQWPGEAGRRSGHPFVEQFTEARDRGLVAGCCAFCAAAFGATEGCRDAGLEMVGTAGEEHGPDVGKIATEGYELLTVG
jgi:hypothetical protein